MMTQTKSKPTRRQLIHWMEVQFEYFGHIGLLHDIAHAPVADRKELMVIYHEKFATRQAPTKHARAIQRIIGDDDED